MGFGDSGSFGIGGFLVRFIMAMIGVDNVEELANFVLEVESLLLDVGFCRDGGRLVGFRAVETRMTFELLLQVFNLMLKLVHDGGVFRSTASRENEGLRRRGGEAEQLLEQPPCRDGK